jgi:hypothetical protein
MAGARNEDVEALARSMLRDTIQRSGWYPSLRGEERRLRIERTSNCTGTSWSTPPGSGWSRGHHPAEAGNASWQYASDCLAWGQKNN